jgi:hypothetical protein
VTGTHNIRFAEAQAGYLRARDNTHLDQMYRICRELAAIYTAKYARGRGLNLSIDEIAHDSAAGIISMYLRKPEFRLEPLSGYLFRCCNTAMWKDRNWDKKTVSMEPLIDMELI